MRKVALFSDERTFWHATGMQALFLPIGLWVQPPSAGVGADTADSKRRILSLLKASLVADLTKQPKASPATIEDLERVHTARYIAEFKAVSDSGGGDIGDVAPFSAGGFEIAQISAGLAIAAINTVVTGEHERAYALCRPAGHHCLPDKSMGFCLLCNIPIAIEAAKAKDGLGKVVVVDWDVHHGNGTQEVYYERDDVLTISVHQENCFPPGYSGAEDRGAGSGAGCNINVPLPPGSGHDTYLEVMRSIVIPAIERFQPELIVVASGLDANALDPLARMLLHSETYREMTSMVAKAADRICGGRLVVVHEGGYSEAYVPFCGQAVVEALLEVTSDVIDPALDMLVAQQPSSSTTNYQLSVVKGLAKQLALA